jgi:hypothetical protein
MKSFSGALFRWNVELELNWVVAARCEAFCATYYAAKAILQSSYVSIGLTGLQRKKSWVITMKNLIVPAFRISIKKAPTISDYLRIKYPSGNIGNPLSEVTKARAHIE